MLKYWSSVFAMAGVAILATAVFKEDWQAGCGAGLFFTLIGAWFYGLSEPTKKRGR